MTDIKRIDLNLLVVLDALLDEGSVTRAAERLSLTQPTVSGMLGRLRTVFEDPLFVRTRRGIVPTPAARALAAPLKRWIADTDALLRPPAFDPGAARTTFRIATNDHFQSVLVAPLIRALRRAAPTVRVGVTRLDFDRLADDLMRGNPDVAITIAGALPPGVSSCALYAERFVGAVRPRHPLTRGEVTVDDFCRFDHVLVSPVDGAFEGPTDEALAALGRRRAVRYSVSSFLVLPEILRGGDLVAVVPERLLRRRRGELATFELPVAVPGFVAVAAWHPCVEEAPAHRWLRERLLDVAGGLPDARPAGKAPRRR